MLIASTMLGAMALSSCSHDEYMYSEEKVETNVNDTYAAAFEKAFGKVGPNVDWGFGRQHAYSRGVTRALTDYPTKGNIQPTLDPPFPSDCPASNFLKEVPDGVGKLPTWGGNAGLASSYYVDEETHYDMVHTHSGAVKLYIKGTINLSEGDTNPDSPRLNLSTTTEVYLLEGSKLILGEVSAEKLVIDAIYIANGATLQTAGLLKANTNTKVYNHGTIKVGTFEVNTSSFLYNVGTLEAESVNVESNNSRIVNDATINCATVVVNAGAVQNNDIWNVTGTTKVNSNNSGWVNNGHWTTYDYAYIGGSVNVINNCLLTVTHDFEMNISSNTGAFKIDTGGGVETANFYGGRDSSTGAVSGPFKIVMGQNAVFKVTGTAQLESGRSDDEGFGIFGPTTGGYAVFQAKNIVRDPYLASINSHGAVTYGGNLYVSAETHFAQGDDGSNPKKWFIYTKDNFDLKNIYVSGEYSGTEFSKGKPNITIPQTTCNPGFKGANPLLYRVIAEDLSASDAGDFDFNDVVFDVVKVEGENTILRLICAGGTLPLRVRGYGESEGREVHAVFGDTTPILEKHPMYNTGAGPNVPATEFTVEGKYVTPADIKRIIIEVYKDNVWMELKATTGEAACKILVDDTFKPVVERRNIADENNKFTNYVQGTFQDDFWWK